MEGVIIELLNSTVPSFSQDHENIVGWGTWTMLELVKQLDGFDRVDTKVCVGDK